VEPELLQTTFDRDLDSQWQRPARRPTGSVEPYQRLLVNPFLATLTGVGGVACIRMGVQSRSLWIFSMGIGLVVVGLLLLQFHCLDCGSTGWLLGFRRHACPAVVARWNSDQERRFPWLTVGTQAMAWLYIIPAVAFLTFMIFAWRR
jgi:hypothetical protein